MFVNKYKAPQTLFCPALLLSESACAVVDISTARNMEPEPVSHGMAAAAEDDTVMDICRMLETLDEKQIMAVLRYGKVLLKEGMQKLI